MRFVSPLNYSEAVCMVGGFDKIHLICKRNQSMFCFTFQCFIFKQPFTSNVHFIIRWLHINSSQNVDVKRAIAVLHLTERSPFSSISFSDPHLFLFELLLKNKEIVNSIGLYKIPLIKVLQYLMMTWKKKNEINTFSVRVNCWKYTWLIIYKIMSNAYRESTNTWSMVIFH